ncbi:MAG: hypothetical protein FJ398_11500 [Verrucomicrobia bacterium]|nr:hypothetical protein [Verrucomicrobiota bacterium]
MGGILTGAMGALQGWAGIWRFAYSHSRGAMFTPSRIGYFDLASDPLSQAAERASLCLFLRGDLQPAPHSVALMMTEADLAQPASRIPNLHPRWHWLAWVTRVGTQVVSAAEKAPTHTAILPLAWQTPATAYPAKAAVALNPYAVEDAPLFAKLKDLGVGGPSGAAEPAQKFFISETGEITIDGRRDVLVLDTPRTAGGYAPAGTSIEAGQGGVRVQVEGRDATVWVSALDGKPIRQSQRLLVTHLTDLQNSNIRYAEEARQTLRDWGRLPHLVRAGKAEVSIRLEQPAQYKVWALAPSGKRLAGVPALLRERALVLKADVAADPEAGARMLYEVSAP